MKKIKLSLAALTLVLAIVGTTTVNATKSQDDLQLCSDADPDHTLCTDEFPIVCCEDNDTHLPVNQRTPRPR